MLSKTSTISTLARTSWPHLRGVARARVLGCTFAERYLRGIGLSKHDVGAAAGLEIDSGVFFDFCARYTEWYPAGMRSAPFSFAGTGH